MLRTLRVLVVAGAALMPCSWVCRDAVAAGTATQSASVPEGVRAFLASNYQAAQEETVRVHRDYTVDFAAEYTLLFYSQAVDWRDGRSPAWLIGYRIARTGNGALPENRIVFVDAYGGVDDREGLRVRLADACSGDDGVAFELQRGRWMFAVSRYEGRHVDPNVAIFTLEPKPKQVFRYDPPVAGTRDPESVQWSSRLYFVDMDDDGAKDVLVDRVASDWVNKRRWREYAAIRWDPVRNRFAEEHLISREQFERVLEAGNQRGGVIQFGQVGPQHDPPAESQLQWIGPSATKPSR